ncbi:MAG: LURP-one-related family protein [Bacteroidia bacterium]|nr:LURP-one-related family protein [Bacteroidia bacterium]
MSLKKRYQLKEKGFTLTDKYIIRDQTGNDAYEVKGKFFSFGDKLSFRSNFTDQELFVIDQRKLSLRPNYRILKDGKLLAELTKEFGWGKKTFEVDVPGPNDFVINGNFWDREFIFKRKREVVATVSKKFWSLNDVYGIEIDAEEDQELILACVVIIDLIMEKGRVADNDE